MERIGVTIITGFLGSGKTTLMRRVVADPLVGPRVAVIVNELGSLGLDEELISETRSTRAMKVQQLVSGCICCSLRSELGDALRELRDGAAGAQPTHILIETSGAARATEASYAVNAAGYADGSFYTEAVITLVDAWNAARAHREHAEVFEDQVRAADLVAVNKGDLVADPGERARLAAWLKELAPRATLLWTEQAALPPALLLGEGDLLPERARVPTAPPLPPPREPPSGAAHGLRALALPLTAKVARQDLEDWLSDLSDRLFRVKGVVDTDEGAVLVQAVGDRVDIDAIAAGSPLQGARRRLLFIGAAPDPAALSADLARLQAQGGAG